MATRRHLFARGDGDTQVLSTSPLPVLLSWFSPIGTDSPVTLQRAYLRSSFLSFNPFTTAGTHVYIACTRENARRRLASRETARKDIGGVFPCILLNNHSTKSRTVTAKEYFRWTFLFPIVNSLLFVQVDHPESTLLCRFKNIQAAPMWNGKKACRSSGVIKSRPRTFNRILIKVEESPRLYSRRVSLTSA